MDMNPVESYIAQFTGKPIAVAVNDLENSTSIFTNGIKHHRFLFGD